MSAREPAASSAWVLLVDDHEDGRDLLIEYLTMQGYTVEGCASAEDALERITTIGSTPSLVITDLSLGGFTMSGTDFAKHLKSETSTSHVPLVAVTGHSDFGNTDGLFKAVLVKPVMLNDLALTIRRVLNGAA